MNTSLFSGPLPYILALAGFLVVVFLVNQFNRKIVADRIEKAKAMDQMPLLAQKMGLVYEAFPGAEEGKSSTKIMEVGSKIHGTYRGIPIEIVMHGRTDQAAVPLGYKYAYSYSMKKYIKWTVQNKDRKHFQIFKKEEGAICKPTGHQAFDEKLALTGNTEIPKKFLDQFAAMGWMNLKLEENTLILNDTFYDQFQSGFKAMKMISVMHPLWGTSAQHFQIDVEKVVKWIDLLVDLIEETGVK